MCPSCSTTYPSTSRSPLCLRSKAAIRSRHQDMILSDWASTQPPLTQTGWDTPRGPTPTSPGPPLFDSSGSLGHYSTFNIDPWQRITIPREFFTYLDAPKKTQKPCKDYANQKTTFNDPTKWESGTGSFRPCIFWTPDLVWFTHFSMSILALLENTLFEKARSFCILLRKFMRKGQDIKFL